MTMHFGDIDAGARHNSNCMAAGNNRPGLPDVTGLVLAGGLARRMGGEDKGLVRLAGRPMIEYVLAALRPQVGNVLINANRNLASYGVYGDVVIPDTLAGYMGPLAGALSGLAHAATEFLLTVPCDAPLLAPQLANRLRHAAVAIDADVAVATDGLRQQPVFLLLRARVRPGLEAYLTGGGRKIDAWFERLRLAEADFSDCPDTFVTVNDPDERRRVEERLLSTAAPR
jgi:molybdopterin-guanine dinucleotide biosynthesis protein A